MPEENQFEYAYRAGSHGRFFYAFDSHGNLIDVDESTLGTYAHFGQSFKTGSTLKIGDKEPNAFGLRLSGNHWKWMQQWWEEGSGRLVRGGGWYNEAAKCEAAFRFGSLPAYRWRHDGLVVALSTLESLSPG